MSTGSRYTLNLSRRTGKPRFCRLSAALHVMMPPQNAPPEKLTHHHQTGQRHIRQWGRRMNSSRGHLAESCRSRSESAVEGAHARVAGRGQGEARHPLPPFPLRIFEDIGKQTVFLSFAASLEHGVFPLRFFAPGVLILTMMSPYNRRLSSRRRRKARLSNWQVCVPLLLHINSPIFQLLSSLLAPPKS